MPVPPMSMPKACPDVGAIAPPRAAVKSLPGPYRSTGCAVSSSTCCDGPVPFTPSDAPSPAELERLAVDLAEGAAGLVGRLRNDRLAVSSKSTATDLVTEVDRATERWLIEQLRERRPDDAVLGEEGGDHFGSSRVRWLLDPIDGT